MGMTHARLLLSVGIILLALPITSCSRPQRPAEAKAADDDTEPHVLRADNKVLKTAQERQDKEIQALKNEIEALKAGPQGNEVEKLRKELIQARGRIDELSKALEQLKPVKQSTVKITSKDLTPESVKKTDYSGAKLLLDGYVVEVRADGDEFLGVIAEGAEGPEGPVLVNQSKGTVAYQIQVHVRGEIATSLKAGGLSRRIQGTVHDIKVVKGEMWDHIGLNFLPAKSNGLVIIVHLDDVRIR
jgi:hypothetical protein